MEIVWRFYCRDTVSVEGSHAKEPSTDRNIDENECNNAR